MLPLIYTLINIESKYIINKCVTSYQTLINIDTSSAFQGVLCVRPEKKLQKKSYKKKATKKKLQKKSYKKKQKKATY